MFVGIAVIAFPLLAGVALSVWGWRVSKRQGGGWWSLAVWLPLLGLGIAILGMALTAISLAQGFETVANTAPEDKAAALQEAISQAMVSTAVSLPVAGGLLLASFILLVVGRSKKPSPPPG